MDEGGVVLIKRKIPTCKGYWCLPGGRVLYGERVKDAVKRQLKQETGLTTREIKFVGIYDNPKRDSRKHAISLGFLVTKLKGNLKVGPEGSDIGFFKKLPKMVGFDHRKIILDGLRLF